jgi:transcriptional regulator with XRE-family HTH domain
MKLTVGERIMVHRIRADITKKELGERAFPDLQAPQMKIQKIEQDRQAPTVQDINAIAKALGLNSKELDGLSSEVEPQKGFALSEKTLALIPKIKTYLKIIDTMAELGDFNLLKATVESMCKDGQLLEPPNGSLENIEIPEHGPGSRLGQDSGGSKELVSPPENQPPRNKGRTPAGHKGAPAQTPSKRSA